MNVITLKQHRYKGRLKNVGDEYDFIGRQERRLALALGWVIEVPKAEEAVKEMVAEEKASVEVTIVTPDNEEIKAVEVVRINRPDDEYQLDAAIGVVTFNDPPAIATVDAVEEEKPKPEKFVVEAVLKPKRTYKRRDMVSDE